MATMDPFAIVSAKRMLDYGHEVRTCLEEYLVALEEVDTKLAKLLTTAANAGKQAPKIGSKAPPTLFTSISFFEEVSKENKVYTSNVRETVAGGLTASLDPVSVYFTSIQTSSVIASQQDLEGQATKVINAIGKSLDNFAEIHKTKSTPAALQKPPREKKKSEFPSTPPPLSFEHSRPPPRAPLTARPTISSAFPPRPPQRTSGTGSTYLSESEIEGVSLAVAVSSHAAKDTKNEFSLEKGDMMYILDTTDPTWWIACRHNRIAQVPSSAIHLLGNNPLTSEAPPLPSRVAPPPLPSLKRVLHKRSISIDQTASMAVKK